MTALSRAGAIVLLLVPVLPGCGGPSPPAPVQSASSPRYVCPDGRSFTTQFDTSTHQTDLLLDGARPHRLDPVPDPLGGVLYQDADFQLRPGSTDDADVLTDRSTTRRETCSRRR